MPISHLQSDLPSGRGLNVWWFSQYASTPDQQFTAQFDLAKRLVDRGHRVTFFSAGFSHYKFQEIRLQPEESSRVDEYAGVRFVWLRTPPYTRNDWRRARNMLVYAWRALHAARSSEEAPDLVIGTTFHPLASLAACLVAISKHCPFVFEVKDLWPLTAVEFGRLNRYNPLAVALRLLEKFLARHASRIMTTLPGAADHFCRLDIDPRKVVWIPNGLELARYEGLAPYSGRLSSPCTLVYAGGLVSANAIETILRAARLEMAKGSDVRFVFVGGGQDKPRLVEMARWWNLQNVEFRDAVPKSGLRRILEEADAFLLSMRNLPALYRYGMSFNKLCDYSAAGRPILFAGETSHNLVEEFRCGIVVPPEDPAALSAAIEQFLALRDEERAEMGRNAIRCARERFDIDMLAGRLERLLLSIVRQPNRPQSAASGRSVPNREVAV